MALKLFGFYNGLDESSRGYSFFSRYGYMFDYIALFQIPIQPSGALNGTPSRTLIQEARRMGVKVLIVISNLTSQGQFSVPVISKLINDEEFADRVLNNIRDLLRNYELDGVNFDLEKAPPEDVTGFNSLLESWTNQLRAENYIVTIDVPAETMREPQDEWKGAYDYRTLGWINFNGIVLMTYEEHWAGSEPGSVASLPWVNQVLDYALSTMPANKLFLGVPLYGYDWVEEGRGRAITYTRANELARTHGAPLQWDESQHSTYFRYVENGRRHTVYFEDLISLSEKIKLAQKRGLAGIALWELNLAYPELWPALQSYLNE